MTEVFSDVGQMLQLASAGTTGLLHLSEALPCLDDLVHPGISRPSACTRSRRMTIPGSSGCCTNPVFVISTAPHCLRLHVSPSCSPKRPAISWCPCAFAGAAAAAQQKYGVRHFVIDHADGIAALAKEIDMPGSVVFARMAVHHKSAISDLSAKFGAPPAMIPSLIAAIAATGAEPALAFNVGSAVTDPEAYRYAIGVAAAVVADIADEAQAGRYRWWFCNAVSGFPGAADQRVLCCSP